MDSDLRSLRASGGARPKADRVVVSRNAAKEVAPRISFFKARNIEVRWLLLGGAAAVAFGAVLVYAWYHLSLPSFPATPKVPAAVAPPAEEAASESATPALSLADDTAPSPSRGIFRKPADRTVAFAVSGSVQSVADLKTPTQRLGEVLATVPSSATSTLIEVIPNDASGVRIPLPSFLALMDAEVLAPAFLSAHFADQFLFFVYRDKQGLLPGYVLTLKPGENWLFLKDEVAKLESSPKLANFFLSNPGGPADEFRDAQVSGAAVRVLDWHVATDKTRTVGLPAGPASPESKRGEQAGAQLLYGWFRGYLIISTSQAGLEAVLPRL